MSQTNLIVDSGKLSTIGRANSLLVDLRLTEMETHEAIVQHLRELYQSGSWKNHGYKSIQSFCEGELGYTQPFAREICVRIGAVLTTSELKNADPAIQARIDRLLAWRKQKSSRKFVPAYRILSNKTLLALATSRPDTLSALSHVKGVGPATLREFGVELLEQLRVDTTSEWTSPKI